MTHTAYRRLRIKLALTQGELAKKLGVTRKTINSRECGRAKITNEAAIAIRGLQSKEPT